MVEVVHKSRTSVAFPILQTPHLHLQYQMGDGKIEGCIFSTVKNEF